jgi:hypothetical protein
MNEPIFKDNMLEAVFRQAVIERFEREIDELSRPDSTQPGNTPSNGFSGITTGAFSGRFLINKKTPVATTATKIAPKTTKRIFLNFTAFSAFKRSKTLAQTLSLSLSRLIAFVAPIGIIFLCYYPISYQ